MEQNHIFIRLLGTPEIRLDGQVVKLPFRQAELQAGEVPHSGAVPPGESPGEPQAASLPLRDPQAQLPPVPDAHQTAGAGGHFFAVHGEAEVEALLREFRRAYAAALRQNVQLLHGPPPFRSSLCAPHFRYSGFPIPRDAGPSLPPVSLTLPLFGCQTGRLWQTGCRKEGITMEQIDRAAFGAFVSQLRREKGLTQRQLAEPCISPTRPSASGRPGSALASRLFSRDFQMFPPFSKP